MAEICFIHTLKPLEPSDTRNTGLIRQHARRSTLQNRKTRDIGDRIKHFTGREFVSSKDTSHQTGKEQDSSKARSTKRRRPHPSNLSQQKYVSTAGAVNETACGSRDDASRVVKSQIQIICLSPRHPYTDYAAAHVRLPVEKIDSLFKAPSFQHAVEPLFSSNPIDSDFRMEAVFPGCLAGAAFLNALLYSVVQTANRNKPSIEGMQLRGAALNNLRNAISSTAQLGCPEIGAIMILQGVAYRWNDVEDNKTHTHALVQIMHRSKLKGPCLTSLGARALFWQDLFAALLIASKRHETHLSLGRVEWRRESRPIAPSSLPVGFAEHRDVLTDELLNCVEDVLELQSTVLKMKKSTIDRLTLSNMQASIESRLSFASQSCQELGEVAECCRIALLFVCFLSFTETWSNALVPSRLSGMLRTRLQNSLEDPIWRHRQNIQVWLLSTASCAKPPDNNLTRRSMDDWTQFWLDPYRHPELQTKIDERCIHSAMEDFVYYKDLVPSVSVSK